MMKENMHKRCIEKTFASKFLTTPHKDFVKHTVDCDDKVAPQLRVGEADDKVAPQLRVGSINQKSKDKIIDSQSACELIETLGIQYTKIETKSGCHVIMSVNNKLDKKNIGQVYKKYAHTGEIGDMMCAVPGTSQGGFEVRFVDV
jgi:hypothetical protein